MRMTAATAQMANRTTVTPTFHAKLMDPSRSSRTLSRVAKGSLGLTLRFRNCVVNYLATDVGISLQRWLRATETDPAPGVPRNAQPGGATLARVPAQPGGATLGRGPLSRAGPARPAGGRPRAAGWRPGGTGGPLSVRNLPCPPWHAG